MTTEELNSIKTREDKSSEWVAGAIEDEHTVWSATAGSYYKMGNDWGDEDHLELEVEKMTQEVVSALNIAPSNRTI
ncbi:hypothetical protein [Klebsiella aerogenes]|uniref:hypothetical protein n=1 Tax=Klebsiella aerogenes TaxID=548 RepID=UPI001E5D52B4|nr:hypothetical protein [Klebsiella aerogenes]